MNILFIEDCEEDALLILRLLKKQYQVHSWERVDTPKAFEMTIDKKHWDLIISDQSMPYFNPLMALKIMKKKNLDIPFILMSGTIGEEGAVEILKAGAHDFIQKGNTARLIPAVERELHEAQTRAEKQAAVASLRRSEETIRTLFNAIHDAVFLVDSYGRILAINKKGTEMLKEDETALLGTSLYRHFRGEMADLRRKKVDEALLTRRPISFDEEHGGHFFENSIFPVHVTSSKATELAIYSRDVTQRKLAERSEKEKARSELSDYMVSALPAFASMIPQEARNVLVRSFTERFERNVRPNFEKDLNEKVKTGRKNSDIFTFYLSWLGRFFSNLGSQMLIEQDGHLGHLYLTACPWSDMTTRNPILCLTCRGICTRSFSWVTTKGNVIQESSIMGGDQRCSFKFSFKEE